MDEFTSAGRGNFDFDFDFDLPVTNLKGLVSRSSSDILAVFRLEIEWRGLR